MKRRHAGWDTEFGKKIESGTMDFAQMEQYILKHGEPDIQSGRQELLENLLNDYV